MKRVNFPLLIGSIILMVLLALSYFPEFFTDRDPIHEEPPRDCGGTVCQSHEAQYH